MTPRACSTQVSLPLSLPRSCITATTLLVSGIYELGKLHLMVIPRIDPFLQYRDHFLGSASHPAFRARPGNVVFDLRVGQPDEAFVVALDKGGKRSPHDLQVLLRHLLLLKPDGSEGLRSIQVEVKADRL